MKGDRKQQRSRGRGVPGCIIEGPISYDLAMDPQSAPIKGYVKPGGR